VDTIIRGTELLNKSRRKETKPSLISKRAEEHLRKSWSKRQKRGGPEGKRAKNPLQSRLSISSRGETEAREWALRRPPIAAVRGGGGNRALLILPPCNEGEEKSSRGANRMGKNQLRGPQKKSLQKMSEKEP